MEEPLAPTSVPSPAPDDGGPDQRARASVRSVRSVRSVGSAGSILSIGSAGSILSIGSVGSILSIGSVGSILSVGSVASAASLLSVASATSAVSVLAWRSIGALGPARGAHRHGPRAARWVPGRPRARKSRSAGGGRQGRQGPAARRRVRRRDRIWTWAPAPIRFVR